MSIEPQPTEFDPSEALSLFAEPGSERYGLSERTFFYLVASCRSIADFSTPAFTIEAILDSKTKAGAGCRVEFVLHQHTFRIDTRKLLVKLWAGSADEEGTRWWPVFETDSANPAGWEGLLKAIGRTEDFYVAGAFADRLRQMFTEWQLVQKRRRDDRGF